MDRIPPILRHWALEFTGRMSSYESQNYIEKLGKINELYEFEALLLSKVDRQEHLYLKELVELLQDQ